MTTATRDLVLTKIEQVFPDRDCAGILACLDRYAGPERDRVHLAVLKLYEEEGKSDPSDTIDATNRDYRDVLMWAETPNQSKLIACCDARLRAEITAQDRAQYHRWLTGR